VCAHVRVSGESFVFLGHHVPGPLSKSLVSTLKTMFSLNKMVLGHLGQ